MFIKQMWSVFYVALVMPARAIHLHRVNDPGQGS